MKNSLRTLFLCGLLGATLSAGCRNPFDPQADVKLVRFYSTTGDYIERVLQTSALTWIDSTDRHVIQLLIYNYSSVGVRFFSYTAVYRQVGIQPTVVPVLPPGQPIAALGGAAGRRYMADIYLMGLSNNRNDYSVTLAPLIILTEELLTYIGTNASTRNGGIDVDVTLYGIDDNDHDVVVGGTFHIEVL